MRRRKNAVRRAGAQVPVYQVRDQLRGPLHPKRKLGLFRKEGTLLPSRLANIFLAGSIIIPGVIGEFFLETMFVWYRLLFSLFFLRL